MMTFTKGTQVKYKNALGLLNSYVINMSQYVLKLMMISIEPFVCWCAHMNGKI
jgi:hypothetical protein